MFLLKIKTTEIHFRVFQNRHPIKEKCFNIREKKKLTKPIIG